MIAVSDTGPLLYLSLIEQTDLLSQLFERVLIPRAVAEELSHTSTPPLAATLVHDAPAWLQIREIGPADSSLDRRLDRGERDALALVLSSGADVFLTDDRAVLLVADTMSIAASGTIGVLYQAATSEDVAFNSQDFDSAAKRLLEDTNFYAGPRLKETITALSLHLHAQDVLSGGDV